VFIRKSSAALVSLALAGAGMVFVASPTQAAVTKQTDCSTASPAVAITEAGPYEFDTGGSGCTDYVIRSDDVAHGNLTFEVNVGIWDIGFNDDRAFNRSPAGNHPNDGLRITIADGVESGTVVVEFYSSQYSASSLKETYTITIGGGGTPAPVISSVSPASGTDAGGTSVTIAGTDLNGATAVTFGGNPATSFTVDDSTQITATTPAGTAGAVDVAVTTPGGDDTSVGAFTYTAAPAPDPTPAPALPPSAPVAPELAPGDGEVTVSWEAPATHGSFPVTHYQVKSVPSGAGCMVRALNGGGWGPWLNAGSVTPVTPVEASIMITGSRGDVRGRPGVLATGSTFGISQGSVLHPWIRLPEHARPMEGEARITLDTSGDFTWQRRTGKPIEVHICTSDRSVCSEEITIAVR